jgi:hypothetical protein
MHSCTQKHTHTHTNTHTHMCSRMVQQQSSRGGFGSGSVGFAAVPNPHGLPPTPHTLSPRNLNSLRHNRVKSQSASRTSSENLSSLAPTLHQGHQQQQVCKPPPYKCAIVNTHAQTCTNTRVHMRACMHTRAHAHTRAITHTHIRTQITCAQN